MSLYSTTEIVCTPSEYNAEDKKLSYACSVGNNLEFQQMQNRTLEGQ